MKSFLIKIFLSVIIIAISIPVFTIYYVKVDPYLDFKILKNYSWKYGFQSIGDISTKKLLNSKIKYNTFILGSSRTMGLYACYVQNKINRSNVFHYASWNETIGGISNKIKIIDSLKFNMKNIIIYLDSDQAFIGNGKSRPNDHYLVTEENEYLYYLNHYTDFFSHAKNLNILFNYKKLDNGLFPNWHSDPYTNDCNHLCYRYNLKFYNANKDSVRNNQLNEALIKNNMLFNNRQIQKFREPQISSSEIKEISQIVKIAKKHNSNIYVILTPILDQYKFNSIDLGILKQHFDNKNIYDFTGINNFTNNPFNYPDKIHFLPSISKKIIDSVLNKQIIIEN